MEKPKVNIVTGGNQGGRRSEKKFGEDPNSIAANFAFLPADVKRRARENQRRIEADHRSLELWAARDFLSNGQPTDIYGEA